MVGINIETPKARPHEVIEDVWFGEEGTPYQAEPYTFTPGPAPDLLSAYLMDEEEAGEYILRAKAKWVREGLHEDDWAEVEARIANPDDPLKAAHVYHMYTALMEEVGKRPPTSPSGSSRPPSRSTGAAKRKPRGATSGG